MHAYFDPTDSTYGSVIYLDFEGKEVVCTLVIHEDGTDPLEFLKARPTCRYVGRVKSFLCLGDRGLVFESPPRTSTGEDTYIY